jgi:hypothetical protein
MSRVPRSTSFVAVIGEQSIAAVLETIDGIVKERCPLPEQLSRRPKKNKWLFFQFAVLFRVLFIFYAWKKVSTYA